jgi:hypothetical protein
VSGQFPPGLRLATFGDPRDANDELVGAPTTTGTSTFTMRVTDFNGQEATKQFTITVHRPLQMTNTTLPDGTVGVPYRSDFTVQGGLPPYLWHIFANDPLPAGLSLASSSPDTDNVLTGTPSQTGTFSFTIGVQDSFDNTVNGTMTITINP